MTATTTGKTANTRAVTTRGATRAVAARPSTLRRRLKRLPRNPLWYFGYLLLLGWTVVTLGPFIAMLLLSFHSSSDIYVHPLGTGGDWIVSNYTTAWKGAVGGAPMSTYLINNVLVAALSLAIGVTAGTLTGYGLARAGVRLSAGVSRVMILALSVPLVVALIPTFELLGSLRLLNSVLGISLVYAAFMTPTIALIMRSVFGAVPHEILEAAKIDGCGEMSALFRVVLPIVKGGILSVTLLGLIFVWSEVQFAIVLLSRPENQTLAVGLLSFKGAYISDQGAFFAGLVIATFPILAVYLVFQRYVTKGVTLGAIK